MDVTKHLSDVSAMTAGTPANDKGTGWVSVILDGEDITVFGEIDQLIEVGKLFLSQAIALRDNSARELLANA